MRISGSSVKYMGLARHPVWGINACGSVTSVSPDKVVHRASGFSDVATLGTAICCLCSGVWL